MSGGSKQFECQHSDEGVKRNHVQIRPIYEQTASIFKLNIDCMDKIFDYLSMRDIILFGQTCKAMQLVCGEYFKQNYSAAKNYHTDSGTYTKYFDRDDVVGRFTESTAFNRFMNKIEFSNSWNYIEWYYDDFASLNHICFRDFADIYFPKNMDVDLDMDKSKVIKRIINKVEIVEIRNVRIDSNVFKGFLKSCIKMKCLYVQHPQLGTLGNEAVNLWLLQRYPLLEHLELIPRHYKVDELSSFLELNPNVRSFSTSTSCLWANRDDFMKSNIKLDQLQVKYFYNGSEENVKSVCNLLEQLHDRGFYKNLHFDFDNDNFNEEIKGVEHIFMLPALEKLYISELLQGQDLCGLKHLKQLVLKNYYNFTDMDILAKGLINLERLELCNANFNDILPFIRHSAKLKHLKIGSYTGTLKLKLFNEERSKLFRARRLSIYVPDNIFLEMKWTKHYGHTYSNFIDIRRISCCDWDHHYWPRQHKLLNN